MSYQAEFHGVADPGGVGQAHHSTWDLRRGFGLIAQSARRQCSSGGPYSSNFFEQPPPPLVVNFSLPPSAFLGSRQGWRRLWPPPGPFRALEVACVAWGFGRAGLRRRPLTARLAARLVDPAVLSALSPSLAAIALAGQDVAGAARDGRRRCRGGRRRGVWRGP